MPFFPSYVTGNRNRHTETVTQPSLVVSKCQLGSPCPQGLGLAPAIPHPGKFQLSPPPVSLPSCFLLFTSLDAKALVSLDWPTIQPTLHSVPHVELGTLISYEYTILGRN